MAKRACLLLATAIVASGADAILVCEWQPGDTAIVCVYAGSTPECVVTNYIVEVCWDPGQEGEEGPPNPPIPWGWVNDYDSDADSDGNGRIDNFAEVLDTDDPCGYKFDNNDRLGTNHGGPNTQRKNHAGVDLQADNGDRVGSVGSGIVDRVFQGAECGLGIDIDHADGTSARYCHLQSAEVSAGNLVLAGETIGRADSTGNSTGPHLHVVYWNSNGTKKEYFQYVDQGPTAIQLNGSC